MVLFTWGGTILDQDGLNSYKLAVWGEGHVHLVLVLDHIRKGPSFVSSEVGLILSYLYSSLKQPGLRFPNMAIQYLEIGDNVGGTSWELRGIFG
jgi:hypothetical protein